MTVKDTEWGQSALVAIKRGWQQAGNYQDPESSIIRWFIDYEAWLEGDGSTELPADPFPSSYPHYREEWTECRSILEPVYLTAQATMSMRPNESPGWFLEFYDSLVELMTILNRGCTNAREPDFCAQAPRSSYRPFGPNPL